MLINFLTDSTTLILNNHVISDFQEGDFIELSLPNPRTTRQNGGNNTVSVQDPLDANVAQLTVRIVGYGKDDVFLNELGATVFNASIKRQYSRDSVELWETWKLENGSQIDQPTFTHNNKEASNVVEYKFEFRNSIREL